MSPRIVVVFMLLIGAVGLNACQHYDPTSYFPKRESRDSVLLQLSPYILRQPEEYSDSIWYTSISDSLRMLKLDRLSAQLFRFYRDENGTCYYCVYQRDNRSLYEDYRGYGGKFEVKDNRVVNLEELFITPQLKIDAVKDASDELFGEIVKSGNALRYIGKSELMQWPSETVVYNKKTHKWDITDQHEFHFLQEMKDSVAKSASGR